PESGEALQLAYYQSSLAVEYLIDEFGLDALRAVLDDLGAGVGIDDALARHAAPLNRLDVGFEQFARRRAEEFGPELTWETPDLPPSADAATIGQWLADRPRSFPGLLRLGQALAREENWPELLAVGETLCRLAPDYAGGGNGYQRRAQAHRGLDDAAAEARALAEWAERSSDALDAYLRQAELAEQAEQWDVAAQAARRALAVHPLQAAPHRTLARTAEQLGRGQEAIAAYRALLEFETTDLVDVHYRLARLLRDAGEADAARRATLAALDEAPRFLAAHRLLLELHDDAGNRVDADAAAPPEEQP
ncbi:MAG TPA: hypothetical protein PKC18_17155, partial [Lacipirellulaceae bacterium]|nr:hypothetical protein [Lacipirellulaceae bacterium]